MVLLSMDEARNKLKIIEVLCQSCGIFHVYPVDYGKRHTSCLKCYSKTLKKRTLRYGVKEGEYVEPIPLRGQHG